jgi:anaerobic selenocysteine-containing dehydrogenase
MPDWQPDDGTGRDAALAATGGDRAQPGAGPRASADQRWPLRLLTAPAYYQPHTAFAGNQALRPREGRPTCVLHPAEAARRGLADGDPVELVSERGLLRATLRVSDEIGPGIALVPGQRPAGDAGGTTVNLLTSDRLSDLGGGATYQSTRLEVRRAAEA